MLFGADRACGVDRSVERDAHHEGVVERREDVRDAEHVLAVARVGHVGLNLLHDRGGDLLFFFSLRESTTMWMSRLADVPGSVAGGSIEAREDGPEAELTRARGRTMRTMIACWYPMRLVGAQM